MTIHFFRYLSSLQVHFLPLASKHIGSTLQFINKTALLLLFLMFMSLVGHTQNTKGDRPPSSNKKQTRETRFKTKSRQGDKAKTKDIAGRRLRTKNFSSANKANTSYPRPRYASKSPRQGKERAGQAYRPVSSSAPRPSEKGFSGTPPRNRVAIRTSSSSSARRNVYPQRGTRSVTSQSSRRNIYSQRNNPYVNNASRKPRDTQRAAGRTASNQRIKVRSVTAQVKKQTNISRQGGTFRNYRSPVIQKPVSNKTQLAKVQRLGSSPSTSPRKKVTVTPRSASRSFIRNKSINPYAGFFRVKRKGEQVTTKDIAGRTLRTRNFRTPAQPLITPEQDPYRGRKRTGERAYKGPAAGYHKSATRTQPRAWVGDVAGRKIRGRNYETKKRSANSPIHPPRLAKEKVGDHPKNNRLRGVGFRSYTANYVGKVGSAIPVKTPGKKADKLGRYQNRISGRRPIMGGGSVSGKRWNNLGQPLAPKRPGIGARNVGYAGNIKAQKRIKGGGSISGRAWNNNGQPVNPRAPGIGAKSILYSGNIKTSKPIKGGGSISGRLWNNNGQPVPVRTPPNQAAKAGKYPGNLKIFQLGPGLSNQGEEFTGFIKTNKPVKGGGSISGRLWNNSGRPVPVRTPPNQAAKAGRYPGNIKRFELSPGMSNQGEEFTGFIKARKPVKGGGSISGRIWNNNGRPVPVRTPPSEAAKAGKYPGNLKHFELSPSMSDQGEEFTGFIKRGKYSKSPYQHASALLKKDKKTTENTDGLHIKVKQPGWARNKYSHEDALLKKDPGSNVFRTDGLQIRVKSPGYVQNKNAHDASVMKRQQSKESMLVDNLTVKMKQPGWVRNKNAHEDALLKRDPGSNVFNTDGLQIRVKSPGYVQNKNAHDASVMKRRQSKESMLVDNLTVKMKQPGWVRNKNAHDDAMLKKDPGKSVFLTDNIYGKIKAPSLKSNPSSSNAALRVREPGKAFAKVTDYQGNIKMQKFNFLKHPDYHPDASFIKNNKNNVKEERGLLTNIRLFWARLFRKNETQPDHLKEKIRKPRYDNREVGLWYD